MNKSKTLSGAEVRPWIQAHLAVTLVWILAALYMIFLFAPEESSMGEVQRIFYIHMPAAVVALTAYALAFVASMVYLAKRSRAADDIAYAAVEVGFVFCTSVLVTGPLWAKPVWGIWWTWDARLTSTFVLWLLFISYLMLRVYLINPDQAEALAAVVSIMGFADAIFDYMSIRWFRTQHPQPVMGGGPGSGLDPKMKLTVVVSLGAFLCLFAYLVRQRVAIAQAARELSQLRRALASKEARG
jgi:heme exporter protein C